MLLFSHDTIIKQENCVLHHEPYLVIINTKSHSIRGARRFDSYPQGRPFEITPLKFYLVVNYRIGTDQNLRKLIRIFDYKKNAHSN